MADQPPHHHGYLWLGDGKSLLSDGPRRANHPEFATAAVMPLENADWLLKPPGFIRATFTDAHAAADWYGAQIRGHVELFASARDRESDVMVRRLAAVVEDVKQGQDAVGGWWLTGQRFLSVALVACSPHKFRPERRCPKPL